ncbi:MAG: hypothetical protein LBS56_04530, partial [Propionibacteriaceae bacterium]|nr:hypothetical protein [Propionibacteriaceae bacterium]
ANHQDRRWSDHRRLGSVTRGPPHAATPHTSDFAEALASPVDRPSRAEESLSLGSAYPWSVSRR